VTFSGREGKVAVALLVSKVIEKALNQLAGVEKTFPVSPSPFEVN